MPLVTVITATSAIPERQPFWEALATSVNCQAGVEVEWLIAAPHSPGADDMLSRVGDAITSPGVALSHVPVPLASTVGSRRNAALRRASGQYVVNLDDDDMLAGAHSLSCRVSELESSGAQWVAGRTVNYGVSRLLDWEQLPSGRYSLPGDVGLVLPEDLPLTIHTSAVLASTDLIRGVGGWHPTLPAAEDIDLLYRLCLSTRSFSMVEDVVLLYRKHAESTMAKISRKDDRELISSLRDQYGLPPMQV